MAAKIICPQCGRRLSGPAHQGSVICDGCEHQFNRGFVWVAPPALWRRIVGVILLSLGALMLFIEIPAVVIHFDINERDLGARMVGMFLLPGLAICGGLALAGGTTLHEERPASKEPAAEGPRDTWEEE